MRRLTALRHLAHFPAGSAPTHATWQDLLTLWTQQRQPSSSLVAPDPMADTRNAAPHLRGPDLPRSNTGQCMLEAGMLGVPNAGKSTLTNALIGQKVTAVSPKTNTTAVIMTGAYTQGQTQVLLYDMPGVVGKEHLQQPKHAQRVKSAWGTASNCDLLLVIIDAYRQLLQPDPRVLRMVAELGKQPLPDWTPPPAVLVLNKVDRLTPEDSEYHLPALTKRLSAVHPFQAEYCVSATTGQGVKRLKDYLISQATPGDWYLEEGEASELTPEELAQEVVREKLFMRLRDELPYTAQLRLVESRPLKDASLRIQFVIVVPSTGARRIVVGRKGSVVGQVGIEARQELEALLKRRVHLILDVTVARPGQA